MIGRRVLLGIGVAAVGSTRFAAKASAEEISRAEISEMERLVEIWMEDRGARVCGNSPRHQSLAGRTLPKDSALEAANLELVGRGVTRLHDGYSGFSCTARILRYAKVDSKVTANVEVRGSFEFIDQTAAKVTSWKATYACVFERIQHTYALIDATYRTSSSTGMVDAPLLELDGTGFNARIDAMVQRLGLPKDEVVVAQPNHNVVPYYNYPAMRSYALAWWDGQNPNDPAWGDDCTNFVSQVLHAGGWQTVGSYPWDPRPDNSKWWYGSYTWSTSYSWSASENLYQFTTISGRGVALSSIWSMITGNTYIMTLIIMVIRIMFKSVRRIVLHRVH